MFPEIGSLEIQKIEVHQDHEESENLFTPALRQSQLAEIKSNWNLKVMAAIEKAVSVDPYTRDLPEGTVVPAVVAANWSGNTDIRPRLLDKSTGQFRLIDTGSMITAAKMIRVLVNFLATILIKCLYDER